MIASHATTLHNLITSHYPGSMSEILWTGIEPPSDGKVRYVDLLCRKSKVLAEDDRLREVSTQEQERIGRAWAARNGYTVRKVWTELGSAYKDRERREFDAAIRALLNGEAEALWCYMLDRFTRKGAEDVLKIIGKARVIFDWDRLDSMDDRDRERIIMEAERARSYSARLSARVSDVKSGQRDKGLWVSGWPPYGLRIGEDRRLYPDDTPAAPGLSITRADVVRQIFQLSAEGASARQLVTHLETLGVPHGRFRSGDWVPDGQRWRPTTVRRWVENPVYAGWQVVHLRGTGRYKTVPYRNARGERVRVIPEGLEIVTDAEQTAAIAGRRPDAAFDRIRSRRRGVAEHLLTTLLKCASCGRNMFVSGESYVCGSIQGGKVCPRPARVMRKAIEPYVFQRWRAYVTNSAEDDDLLAVISERWARAKHPEETAEAERARETLRAAERRLEQVMADRRAGVYDGPAERFFRADHKEAVEAVRQAQRELEKIGGLRVDISFLLEVDQVTEYWEGLSGNRAKQRELLSLVVDRIEVKPTPYVGARFDGDSRVIIHWAQPEEL